MKDNLQDLIQHTHGLGIINLIKIVGTDKETLVSAVSEDKTVIVSGKTNDVITEFVIEFADGRRYRNKHAFPGCEVFSDDVGMSQFDDIRESALADAERLATKIKASSKEINLDFWFKLPARDGSDAYSEAQVMAWERNVA